MMKLTSFKVLKLAVIVICMLAAGICYSCSMGNSSPGPEDSAIMLGTSAGETSAGATSAGAISAGTTSAGETLSEETSAGLAEKPMVYVHVCGLVCSPGVYGLPQGSRVYEAIEAAGGFSENAAPDYLNLAGVLEDGMKLQVPDRAQADQWMAQGLTSGGGQAAGGRMDIQGVGPDSKAKPKVNLNTASMEELMTLRGIGESRAEDIIRYRDRVGGFKSIEDIMNVSGIKEAAFEKIKDSITV